MTGDNDAAIHFSSLYYTYYPLILTTCIRRLGNRAIAEDATQETFRIAWQHFPKEDLDIAWLYATARNVIGNEYRRTARSNAAHARLEVPHADVSDSTDALDLRAAMTRLRASDRELLYMAYWEDLSGQEMSGILGVSLPAVWVRLTRAREALRALLGEINTVPVLPRRLHG